MNEGISVRTCTHADIDTLISIGIKTFRDTFDEFNTPDNMLLYLNRAFARKKIEEEIKEPGTAFFLAFDGRNVVGYAKVSASDTPEGITCASSLEIQRLYAHKQYIGKRVGYMLLQTCLSLAKKKGCEMLWLGVWENNARAIAFYNKYGFEKFGEHTFMLGNDRQTDWLMKKILV